MAMDASIELLIGQFADLYRLPEDLLTGQVLVESSGDPYAFKYEPAFFDRYIRPNPKAHGYRYGPLAASSYGLLQIMLETAMEIGFTDAPELLFMPRVGLNWGAKRMAQVWKLQGGRAEDYPKALAAYNGGFDAARTVPFRNQKYVDAVYKAAGRTTQDQRVV